MTYLSPVSFFAGGELLFFESLDSRLEKATNLQSCFSECVNVRRVRVPHLSGLESVEGRFKGWLGFDSLESFLQQKVVTPMSHFVHICRIK